MSKTQGQMRLQREARMAKKDMDAQIKKHGKIVDNFVCLPDPEDAYTWYYVVFGLSEPKEFEGGYYFGKITCPKEYPAKAPNIKVFTPNGRFRTTGDGICLSISDFHPESWNPAWKVNQIVIGLVSFWLCDEYTYGAVESYDFPNDGISLAERRTLFASESRKHVLEQEKFAIFKDYAEAMGITAEAKVEAWVGLAEKHEKLKAEFKIKEEERLKQEAIRREEDRIRREKERVEQAQRAKAKQLAAQQHQREREAKLALQRQIAEEKRIELEMKKLEMEKQAAAKKKFDALVANPDLLKATFFKALREKNLVKLVGKAKELKRIPVIQDKVFAAFDEKSTESEDAMEEDADLGLGMLFFDE